jgi:hypothetical protein
MRNVGMDNVVQGTVSVPRGWVILSLAVTSWIFTGLTVQLVGHIFSGLIG